MKWYNTIVWIIGLAILVAGCEPYTEHLHGQAHCVTQNGGTAEITFGIYGQDGLQSFQKFTSSDRRVWSKIKSAAFYHMDVDKHSEIQRIERIKDWERP